MKPPLARLHLSDWLSTRDSLHRYARMVGKLRAEHAPPAKHWWHSTLHVSARVLTTTPFPAADQALELALDLVGHELVIDSSDGWRAQLPLREQTASGFRGALIQCLSEHDVKLDAGALAPLADEVPLPYDPDAAGRFRQSINWSAGVFAAFKGRLREETSPIQVFPHHFDLAMNWFSGRLVPGVDPLDEERADEHMNFGFATGDESIDDAYFYATAYPQPDGFTDLALPGGAFWHTEGWAGAILPYAALLDSDWPADRLLDFLRTLQAHGAELMSR